MPEITPSPASACAGRCPIVATLKDAMAHLGAFTAAAALVE
jgi:hypothetical protein